jgi:hypothetical protein
LGERLLFLMLKGEKCPGKPKMVFSNRKTFIELGGTTGQRAILNQSMGRNGHPLLAICGAVFQEWGATGTGG